MSYRNTMKLFASNFTLVWKQVVYFIICLLIFVPITYSFAKPILQLFNDSNIGATVDGAFTEIYVNGGINSFPFTDAVKEIITIIVNNFAKIWSNVLLIMLFGMLLPFIFLQISSFNLASIMYKKLSMNMNVGYTQNLLNTLKSSILYALMNIVYRLPFWTISVLSIELYLFVSNTIIGKFLGLVVLSAVLIIVNAFKHALFSVYTSICVEQDHSPIYAFIQAFPITMKNFLSIMATSIVFQLTRVAANTFIAVFTFFAGLLLMIPATFVFTSIFYVVIYFNKTGQRYYMGNNYIYNPVKYSVKRDEYADKLLDPEEPIEEQYVTAIDSLHKNNIKKNK